MNQLLEKRIRKYRAKLPNLGEGQGRDRVAFTFPAWLVNDMAAKDNTVVHRWLSEWDAGNRPPKRPDRLAEIIRNAREYGQRP